MILLIGDIQGCDEALARLLDEAGFSASRDHLVALGDLVNRGPQSLAVLERLASLGDSAQCILGNHDLHLLAASQGVRPLHRSDTLGGLLASPKRDAWLDWLRHQPLALQAEGWLCVHAGVPPAWSSTQTLEHAGEVSALLGSDAWKDLLKVMYGNQPSTWHDGLRGEDRWRFIINALTRMRFCSAQGELDFEAKEGAGSAPPGFMPWFEVPGRRSAGTPIAFGHWSTLGLINRPDLLALDTGCVWGGQLSAARVDSGRRDIIQVPCTAQQRSG